MVPTSKYLMWEWHATISKFSFTPTIAKQPEISCTPCYTCPYVASVKSFSGNIPKAILQHISATTGPREQLPDPRCVCSTAARTDSYHVTRTPLHNIPQCPLGTGYRWRSHHQSWPRRKSPLQGWPLRIDRSDHSCACWWLSVQGTDPGVQP